MQVSQEELNKVKVKNFPLTFSFDDKRNFVTHFGAKNAVVVRDFVIATFKNEKEATGFLKNLHQKEILGRRLRVEYFTKALETKTILEETSSNPIQSCNDYVLKWLSKNSDLDFNLPPPPYLRYKYPKVTREIIDSICVALESVPKFYTQVLHLMNKMNLPPPFTQAAIQQSKVEKKFKCVACQTEVSNVKTRKRIWSGGELMSDESEIESDDEQKKCFAPYMPIKRTKKPTVVMQNPAKRFLQTQILPKSTSNKSESPSEFFETDMKLQERKITVKIPNELNSTVETPSVANQIETNTTDNLPTITREGFALNRLTPEQQSILPVFKNYQPGIQSNKLYLKNLAKNVTIEDLQSIYWHFVKKDKSEIEIKLMQSGRMKGQAFVTFKTPYDEDDLEENGERMIDMALKETNGYLLKDKPMVVMYGKGS